MKNERNDKMKKLFAIRYCQFAAIALAMAGCRVVEVENRGEGFLTDKDGQPVLVNGQPVKVTFMFPVIYQVRGDKDDPKPAGQTISIRSASGATPLIILDGVKYIGELSAIDPSTIEKMEVLKDEETLKKYGDEAKNGVILITSKKQ